MGNSGWWILLGPLAILLNLFIKGQAIENKYGKVPIRDQNFLKVILNLNENC